MTDNRLPKGWAWARLGNVGDYVNGRAFKPSEWEQVGRPILRIQNLTKSTDTINRYSKPIEAKYIVKDGDILISWSATLGVYVYRGEDAVLNQHIFKVRSYIDDKFLRYLVDGFLQDLKGQVHGTGMQHITKGKFDESPIPLAPILEQHRIVAKLEELFTRLDAGTDALNKIQLQLKHYRQSVLKSAFSGKLTAEWRKAHKGELEPASKLLDRIKQERKPSGRYKELPPLDSTDLPKLPEEWEWTSLESVVEINPKPEFKLSNEFEVSFIPMRSVEAMTGMIDTSIVKPYGEVKKGFTHFQDGDVLFAKITPCMENGKVAVAKGLKNSLGFGSTEFHVIRPLATMPSNIFFFYLLQGNLRKDAQRNMTGTAGQLRVPAKYLSEVSFPLAPLNEQGKIVEEIERHYSIANQIENTLKQSLIQSDRLRQSILTRAFEGRLVSQNPDDEPAEKLLERIKAQKANRYAKQGGLL